MTEREGAIGLYPLMVPQLQFFSVQSLSPLCLCRDNGQINIRHGDTEDTKVTQRLSN